jgi:hypothetical protein
MEISWTILAYIIIGLFALSGFFKGWWKEAVTTWFLAFLVFLLYFPPLAQLVISLINFIFATIARLLPNTWRANLQNFLEATLGITTVDGAIQLDAGNGGTWLVILLLFIGLAIFISRSSLPSDFRSGLKEVYRPGLWASLLGAAIGALNGFIIISLITAYLNGANLPGATAAVRQAAPPAQGLVQAVAVPNFVITESFLPWILIVIGLVVFVLAISNRIVITRDKEGYVKVDYRKPLGYEERDITVRS